MVIKETSKELTKVEIYLMTMDANIVSAKNVEDGTEFIVESWLIFTDTDSDGKESEYISLFGKNVNKSEKEVWVSQSTTFRESFNDMWNLFEGEPITIVKNSGKTKSGRDYINCSLKI